MFYLPNLKRRTLSLNFITGFVLALFSGLSISFPPSSLTSAFLLFTFYELYRKWVPSIAESDKIHALCEKKPELHALCEEVQKNMIDKGLLSANKKIAFYITDNDSAQDPVFDSFGFYNDHTVLIGTAALKKLRTAQGTFDEAAFQSMVAHELSHVAQNALTSNNLLKFIDSLTGFSILSNVSNRTYLLLNLLTSLSLNSIKRNYEYDADHLVVKSGYGKGLQRSLALIADRTEWDSRKKDQQARPSFFQSCFSFIKELFSSHPSTKHRILAIKRDIALQETLQDTPQAELQTPPRQGWIEWGKNCYHTGVKEVKHAFHNELESYAAHFQPDAIFLEAKNNQNAP